jgi:hypothetical protein
MAAFTLAGYMAAEALGRTDSWAARRLVKVTVGLAAVAAAVELLRGFAPDTKASALRCLVAVAGSSFGAAVYGLQLDSILGWFAEAEVRQGSRAAAERDAAKPPAADAPLAAPPAPALAGAGLTATGLPASVLAEAVAASTTQDPTALPPAGSPRSAVAVFASDS